MQNLPSNSKFSKLVKSCFVAEEGSVMVGADFSSLEDRINALLTKDPNKLRVYTALESYQINLNGNTYCFDGETVVSYLGNLITVKELYELSNSTL